MRIFKRSQIFEKLNAYIIKTKIKYNEWKIGKRT